MPSESRECQFRHLCTRSKKEPREIHIRPKDEHLAIVKRRKQQKTKTWSKKYNQRAGVEGTISQGVRAFGLRHSLAVAAPDWLAKRLKKDWFDRYGRRVENYRLPKLDSQRENLGNQMGEDGFNLLKKNYAPNAPVWISRHYQKLH